MANLKEHAYSLYNNGFHCSNLACYKKHLWCIYCFLPIAICLLFLRIETNIVYSMYCITHSLSMPLFPASLPSSLLPFLHYLFVSSFPLLPFLPHSFFSSFPFFSIPTHFKFSILDRYHLFSPPVCVSFTSVTLTSSTGPCLIFSLLIVDLNYAVRHNFN